MGPRVIGDEGERTVGRGGDELGDAVQEAGLALDLELRIGRDLRFTDGEGVVRPLGAIDDRAALDGEAV